MTMTTREPISIENGRVEIHTPENRVWLTRHQIADLFGVFVPAVGSNIRSILKSGILREERVYRRERNRDGGIVELYSLEMIAALAFRLKSGNAEAFRRWLVRRATTTASLECPASGGFQFIQCLAGLFQTPEEIRHTRIVLVDEIMAHNAAVLG